MYTKNRPNIFSDPGFTPVMRLQPPGMLNPRHVIVLNAPYPLHQYPIATTLFISPSSIEPSNVSLEPLITVKPSPIAAKQPQR